jgi:hypothetical protein
MQLTHHIDHFSSFWQHYLKELIIDIVGIKTVSNHLSSFLIIRGCHAAMSVALLRFSKYKSVIKINSYLIADFIVGI